MRDCPQAAAPGRTRRKWCGSVGVVVADMPSDDSCFFTSSRHLWSVLSRTYKVVVKISKWASHLTRWRVPDGMRGIALFVTVDNGPRGRCRLTAVGPRSPFVSLSARVAVTGRWCLRGASPRRGLVAAPFEVCAAVADPVALLVVLLSRELGLDSFLARLHLAACYYAPRARCAKRRWRHYIVFAGVFLGL